jgi:hypothetical protein
MCASVNLRASDVRYAADDLADFQYASSIRGLSDVIPLVLYVKEEDLCM